MTIRPGALVTFPRPHMHRGSATISTCAAIVLSVTGDTALVRPLDRRLRPRNVKLEKLTKERTMAKQIVDELRNTREWHPILQAVNAAIVSMGTFVHPLDDTLIGLTWGQWQMEQAKRVAIAAIEAELTAAKLQLDWDKAIAHLELYKKEYDELPYGYFALAVTIMPLKSRLDRGERTKWLYDDIMEVE